MDAASALDNRTEGLARWSLRLFGDFQLTEHPGGEKVALPGKRERVLLAYLALSPKGSQPRRKLVTLLWGDAADETTLDNLRNCLWNLRKALGDTERQVIASEDRDIVLDAGAFEIDVLAFRRLAAPSGLVDLEQAAKLYSGDFLEGLSIESEEFESWRREEATRCRDQAVDVLNRLMAELSASDEHESAIEVGLRILRLEPLHEATVRSLMRLYGESGRRGTAVELYRTHVDALRKELDIQPEADTRAVYTEITRGSEEQTPAVTDTKSLPPPATRAHANGPGRALSPAEHFVPAIGTPASIARQKAKRRTIGWFTAAGLAVAAVSMLLVVPFAPSTSPTPTGGPATVVAATPTSAIALAVLPFANLSSDPEQEFFSDGLTEEITSVLAKIPTLSVVARTSAFEFKGQNRNIRTIGEQLGATHLIEGSVRKEDNRVRITVQLIQADNGVHVWNESYDRELTGVFAIQEDIAAAIAGALRIPLGLKPGERLVSSRTIDAESYQQYLQAKALVVQRGVVAIRAVKILEPLVMRYPDYAPAWGVLARAYEFQITASPAVPEGPIEDARRVVQSWQAKAESAARRAIELDPTNMTGYFGLALVQWHGGRWADAEKTIDQGLALDPNDPLVLAQRGSVLWRTGRLKESLAAHEKVRALEPLVPIRTIDTALLLHLNGQNKAAIAMLEALPSPLNVGNTYLARAYAGDGRYTDAADILPRIPAAATRNKLVEDAAHILRSAPTKVKDAKSLPSFGADGGELSFVYAYVGATDRLLDYPEREGAIRYFPDFAKDVWTPAAAPMRKTERFKKFVRDVGLVDYWRAKGWPDLCRPTTGDDFECS